MATYTTAELKKGKLYRCALSGQVVLVVEERPYQGLYHNPVSGLYERIELQDGQLQPVESPWPVT